MNRTSFRWADRHDRRRKGIDDPGVTVWLWAGFALFVTLVLALDLWVFHRKAHVVGMREAAVWYSVWVGMALLFSLGVFVWMGQDKGLEFLAGYIIELSLSVDNLFVFMVIFASFAVPIQYQHRVLFYGILGALLMRGAFIATGVTMLHLFHWTTYLFGAFLVVTAFRLALGSNKEIRPEHNPVIRIARRFLPISQEYHGQQFFLKRHGKWLATPLLLVLLIVETTDLVFALDSVPAVLAISRDPFIVYTSNIFGILGLRAPLLRDVGLLETIPLPERRPGAGAGIRRREDAPEQLLCSAHRGVSDGHRRDSCGYYASLPPEEPLRSSGQRGAIKDTSSWTPEHLNSKGYPTGL